MHTKQRIELFIERMAYKRAGRILEAAGATGYTVLPALAGFGSTAHWRRDSDISGSRDMVQIVSIVDDALVEPVTTSLRDLLGDHIGIVTVSTVQVLRPERF
ncbi:MAG: DUF190 domain-containing protein [Ahrensia sp.]|nr:DUF190 domain-containing protein [Ahrensia sp.]